MHPSKSHVGETLLTAFLPAQMGWVSQKNTGVVLRPRRSSSCSISCLQCTKHFRRLRTPWNGAGRFRGKRALFILFAFYLWLLEEAWPAVGPPRTLAESRTVSCESHCNSVPWLGQVLFWSSTSVIRKKEARGHTYHKARSWWAAELRRRSQSQPWSLSSFK